MSILAGLDCGVSANEYSCAHGAQINFGDLTPYLTYPIFYISTVVYQLVLVNRNRDTYLQSLLELFCMIPKSPPPSHMYSRNVFVMNYMIHSGKRKGANSAGKCR
jgi:hypothetical protein